MTKVPLLEKSYLSGSRLWGDDFEPDEIDSWFADEAEGYSKIGFDRHTESTYGYRALNMINGFQYLPDHRYGNVLGVGSARGCEFLPIAHLIDNLTILESSLVLRANSVRDLPIVYANPQPSGMMPWNEGVFNLVLCLGVLHHIPNVSTVLTEMARVTDRGGYLLIREPIVSMGDWRLPRKGLTKRERGIPVNFFRQHFSTLGLEVVRETFCMFPLTSRLSRKGNAYNSTPHVVIDRKISAAVRWNYSYHATTLWEKIRPTSIFYVLRKP